MNNTRRRVLHVINGEFYSGAERVQDLLAAGLAEHGYDVGFALIKPGAFGRKRFYTAAPLHELPMRHRLDLAVAWRLSHLLRTENYALLHTHTPRAALIGAVASLLAGVPMVHHVHSPTAADTEHHWRNRINALVENMAQHRARFLLPVSASLRRHLQQQGIADNRIRTVPNGVPVRTGAIPSFPRHAPPAIGVMALFRPRKGMEVLIEALGRLHARGIPFRLLAVGDFETAAYADVITSAATRAGIAGLIEWTGFRRDVDAQLDRMDVFVLPSTYGEGMPMVVLEAMATGIPVVATRVEGIPEVIVDGEHGLLAAPGDAGALADALAHMLDNAEHAQRLGGAGRIRQQECFSDRSMAAATAAVYGEVLDIPPTD